MRISVFIALCACFTLSAFAQKQNPSAKPADKSAAKPAAKPAAITNAAEAGLDYKIQGEYAGPADAKEKWAAQVVALGDGKFDVYILQGGLPGAGWDQQPRKKIAATTDADGKVALASGGQYTGDITDGKLALQTSSGEKLPLAHVERTSPTLGAKPPAGAKVLFDGSNADQWKNGTLVEEKLLNVGTSSKDSFQNFQLHLEFRTPFQAKARGQGRGNSGVYLGGIEIQVLDSFGLNGENNECGGLYGKKKPDVNMCLPPLAWQTYDVEHRPIAGADVKANKCQLTVRHNGVLIHDKVEIGGNPKVGINLQNHGNPVAYRNIWLVEKTNSE